MLSDYGATIVSAAAVLAPVIAGAVVVVLRALSVRKATDAETDAKRDKSALGPLRDALDRQQRQIEAQAAHSQRQQEVIDRHVAKYRACREGLIAQYGHLVRMRDFARRMAAAVRRLGDGDGVGQEEPPPLPPDPAVRGREEEDSDEFEWRQLRQANDLLQSGVIPPPPPLPATAEPTTKRGKR